jgi:cell wall-associated NlpC family hydrolase
MREICLPFARVLVLVAAAFSPFSHADEAVVVAAPPPVSFVDRASATAQDAIDQALDLLGIRYRRGGSSPDAGFDCSGFVSHVFREGLGLILPRSSKEMSKSGEVIARDELKPGDLVFFNTMRSAFSTLESILATTSSSMHLAPVDASESKTFATATGSNGSMAHAESILIEGCRIGIRLFFDLHLRMILNTIISS